MKRFIKSINILICLALLTGAISACTPASPVSERDSLFIVATVFPEYDWLRVLTDGTDADIRLLTENGVDLHSYQPGAKDMIDISTCDLFLYVGGESDAWVADALKEGVNRDRKAISLIEALGDAAVLEETVEGMQSEEEPEEEASYDEHVWLSLRNAQVLCTAIADALCEIDPENRGVYRENLSAYLPQLQALDEAYRKATESSPHKTVLFGDRFPFRYLTEDYGLNYYAAFAGCSAESEASFETVVFLANKADELQLPVILITEASDGSIARIIKENTTHKDLSVRAMDSMQSTKLKDAQNGVTYLRVMEQNLQVLKEALQ